MVKNIFLTSALALAAMAVSPSAYSETALRMATTTSTQNSGLLDVLDPPFEKKYGVRVDVIAAGTGKSLRIGANGDVDIVFVHAPPAEMKYVKKGFFVQRAPVMHNDFILVGPKSDPADIKQVKTAVEALTRIAAAQSEFISRGDDSGTDKKEKALWKAAQLIPQGGWYNAAGQGMGAVLTMADEKQAYTLTDRGTYLAYRDKIMLVPLFEGDPVLYNPYHIMAVNPKKYPQVHYDLALKYIAYVTGAEGQSIIAGYKKKGQQLFYPDVIAMPAE